MRVRSGDAAKRPFFALFAACAVGAAAAGSCADAREKPSPSPTWREDVAPIVAARCASCHGGGAPAGGLRLDGYLDAIGCVGADRRPATSPPDARAPLVAVLATPDHTAVLSPDERAVVERWIAAGAPAFAGSVHSPGIVDPRSPAFHGALLRERRWAPMLDGDDVDACGRCHDGAPARPAGVSLAAPGATSCTSCHAEPSGPLACPTCHGDGARAAPPRDPCFFPADRGGAHRAHVEGSATLGPGMPCSTCHAEPGSPVISGAHGDGRVQVELDPARAGAGAAWDPATGTCTVACHDHGGARARPRWADTSGPMGCGDCHGSPPASHYAGACTTCHLDADATGTALASTARHLNGWVDLGDGSGTCGACHGKGDDPWPAGGAHPSHRAPRAAAAVACASCHVVPAAVGDEGHLQRGEARARVTFAGPALARGASPTWDGTSCRSVPCHGAGLAGTVPAEPRWGDLSGAARACGACHGTPPGAPHTASATCESVVCHGGEVAPSPSGPTITAAGKPIHVDGKVDLVTP